MHYILSNKNSTGIVNKVTNFTMTISEHHYQKETKLVFVYKMDESTSSTETSKDYNKTATGHIRKIFKLSYFNYFKNETVRRLSTHIEYNF